MIISKVNKRKSCTPFLFKEFQESVLNRVKEDHCVKATTSHENKRRRTVCLARKNGVFGFTIQTYGIRREGVDLLVNHDNEQPSVQLITYIDYVALDGPACYAGLKRGDVILAVNGLSMESSGHEDLVTYIASQQTIRMVVLFEDCSHKIDLNLRYLKLKEILEAKIKELAFVELQEKVILSSCTERDVLASLDYHLPTTTTSFLKPCHHSSPGPLFIMTPPPPPPTHRSNVKRLSAAILMLTTRSTVSASKRKTLAATPDLPTSVSHTALSSGALASRPLTLPLPNTLPLTVPFIYTPPILTCSSPLPNLSDKHFSKIQSSHCLHAPQQQALPPRSASFATTVGHKKPIRSLIRSQSEHWSAIHHPRSRSKIRESDNTISPKRCSTPLNQDRRRSHSAHFEILNLSRSPNDKTKVTPTPRNSRDIKGCGDGKGLRFTRL